MFCFIFIAQKSLTLLYKVMLYFVNNIDDDVQV